MAAFISRKKFVGKMISSQLVLSLLSIMLSFSTGTISKVIPGLSYITAFLALGFYLYYVYTEFWKQGQHDTFSRRVNHARSPLTALWVSFLCLIPSLVVSLVCFVTAYIPSMKTVFFLFGCLNYVVHGMYCGITACEGLLDTYYWHEPQAWLYLAVLIPGFLAGAWGYGFGARSKRLGAMFGMESPRYKRD
ncbi:MAG TPA: hypothetical protein DER23_06285 [Clostridiales bacterium]|jgi:uncharacterized membrane protein required for colicin V production|nr:hypothetical protein [Clostridiales bacterium]